MVDKILWAKKSLGDDGNPKWLPLYQHLLDTKNVINMLYNCYLSTNQRQIINDSITNSSSKKLISFLALSHDFGKSTPAFQLKKSYDKNTKIDKIINQRLIKYGYLPHEDYKLIHPNKSLHALAGEALLYKYRVNDSIGAIIGGHHGKPVDRKRIVKRNMNNYPSNYYLKISSIDCYHKKWEKYQNRLFKWILHKSHYDTCNDIPVIKDINAQVILNGLLIMSDWIASSEDYFPLFDLNTVDIDYSSKRWEKGLRKWFQHNRWHPHKIDSVQEYYHKRFNFKPNELQQATFNAIQKVKHPGLLLIEADMGIGKTEASLVSVEQLAKKNNCTGLFYCLPTQATTNSMFDRVSNWVQKLMKDTNQKTNIRLIHGKAALNENVNKIPRVSSIGDDQKETVMVNTWFTGSKKAVLDDFVISTVDNLLKLALKQKHLALRHLGLSKKVVVIDEAHSFDDYMQSYLKKALNWLGHYHVPVVILSATLSQNKRKQFINSYLDKPENTCLPIDENKQFNYPILTYTHDNQISQVSGFHGRQTKQIIINYISDDYIVETLKQKLSDGGIAGIIVNTVKRAQKIAKHLKTIFGNENVSVIHASFIATQRITKENNLINLIGKNGNRPFLHIVVGTQVLEQSLDIDFDLLITDLSPIDLIIQRLGRLHRHNINRPTLLKKPQIYILQTKKDYNYEIAPKLIYGNYLLMCTQHVLDKYNYLLLPDNITHLIDDVYNLDKSLNFTNPISQETYKKEKSIYKDKLDNEDTRAEIFQIDSYEDVGNNLIGWLKNSDINDVYAQSQVRDGQKSIEVILLRQTIDKDDYTLWNDLEYPLKDKINNYDVAQKIAKNTINLPIKFSNSNNFEETVEDLSNDKLKYFSNWDSQPWLQGKLVLMVDYNGYYKFKNGYIIHYDNELGLVQD